MGTATILGSTDNAELCINGICKAMSNQYLSTQGMNGEGTILNWYGTFTGNDGQKCNQTGWAALWNSTYHLRKSSSYLYYPWFYYYKLIAMPTVSSATSTMPKGLKREGFPEGSGTHLPCLFILPSGSALQLPLEGYSG